MRANRFRAWFLAIIMLPFAYVGFVPNFWVLATVLDKIITNNFVTSANDFVSQPVVFLFSLMSNDAEVGVYEVPVFFALITFLAWPIYYFLHMILFFKCNKRFVSNPFNSEKLLKESVGGWVWGLVYLPLTTLGIVIMFIMFLPNIFGTK